MFRTNQWAKLSLVLLIALAARLSLADEEQTKMTAATNTANTNIELSVGPDMAVVTGGMGTGFGFQVGGLTQVTQALPLFVGADLGMNFWSQSATVTDVSNGTSVTTSSTYKVIQIMPTAIYKFELVNPRWLHPYAGVSAGIGLQLAPLQNTVLFEGFVRPGVSFDVAQGISIAAEPKCGLLSDNFIFEPTIYASFTL
jgi:hypothetical protein